MPVLTYASACEGYVSLREVFLSESDGSTLESIPGVSVVTVDQSGPILEVILAPGFGEETKTPFSVTFEETF